MIDLGDMLAVSISRPSIAISRVSATELCITAPVGDSMMVEWVLRTYPATGVWGIWSIRGLVDGGSVQLIEDGSTMEYAFQIGRTEDGYQSGVTYDFVGGGHGSEVLHAVSFSLDGKPLSGSASGAELVVCQVIASKMPRGALAGTAIGSTHLRHRFTAAGLQVDHSHAITTPGLSYRTAYGAMLPGHKAAMNRAQCDDGPMIALQRGGTIPVTGQRGNVYRLWHDDSAVNPFGLSMSIEAPEVSGVGWSLSTPPGAWLFDRADYSKWYVDWIGDAKNAARSSVHRQSYFVKGIK